MGGALWVRSSIHEINNRPVSVQPIDERFTSVTLMEHQPAKIRFPPPNFPPPRNISPGGMHGRGVSSQIQNRPEASNHRAAFRRATGAKDANFAPCQPQRTFCEFPQKAIRRVGDDAVAPFNAARQEVLHREASATVHKVRTGGPQAMFPAPP